ncbi:MAG: DUF86 domain-containing protein [Cytophagales bacterium]|nr:DUF86 domain-containing protein [Cytophagales bacterium]
MSKRDTTLLFQDMLPACERITQYVSGMAYNEFVNDFKTVDATVRNIQILGEAANQVLAAFQAANAQIEWTKIIRSRHILVHQYFELDHNIIWRITQDYIPPLLQNLTELVKGN